MRTPAGTDFLSKTKRSALMSRIRGKGTRVERTVFRLMRRRRVSFSAHVRSLPGCPDIAFRSCKLAVFIDGDFWHGRQWKTRGLPSLEKQFAKARAKKYWVNKISRNVRRDRANAARLRMLGWKVMRLWESNVNRDPQRQMARILRRRKFLTEMGCAK